MRHSAQRHSMHSVVCAVPFMLSLAIKPFYAECWYVKCNHVSYHDVQCYYAQCHGAI